MIAKIEKVLKEILKLPDGAFMADEDVQTQDPSFRRTFQLLINRRKYLENLLEEKKY